MRYRVTGGSDGVSGIDVAGRRYEPGDVVEMTATKAEWLVDAGLLQTVSGRASQIEPEQTDDASDDIADDSPSEIAEID